MPFVNIPFIWPVGPMLKVSREKDHRETERKRLQQIFV